MRMKSVINITSTILLVLTIGVTLFSCVNIFNYEQQIKVLKTDNSTLSNIQYGMLDTEIWKEKIATILARKVEEIELSSKSKQDFKQKIEKLLHTLIDQVVSNFKQSNSKSGVMGFVKNIGLQLFVDVDDIKSNIPQYADTILAYLEKKENREQLKQFILDKINKYLDETVGEKDRTAFNEVMTRNNCLEQEACITYCIEQAKYLNAQSNKYGIALLIALAIQTIILILKRTTISFIGCIITCLILLTAGVQLPMINIDARIASFSFTLIGEKISFADQVLFFQSKSILDVITTLFQKDDLPLIAVATLIFTFSILFPLCKLIASTLYIFNIGTNNKVVNFLAFKSGKWSMADVMVVAILMSYIGFNGLVNSQLIQLEQLSNSVEVLTTNHSDLKIGFYLFTLFCVLSLVCSQCLQGWGGKNREELFLNKKR